MKAPHLFVVVALVIASTHVVSGFQRAASGGTPDLLSVRIDDLELEAVNIHVLLEELSDQKNIPIGLEVSSYDNLSQPKPIRLRIQHGTVADALNSIVKQNPLYSWKIQDDVVNVFPVEGSRDPVLLQVLETKLEKFSIPRGTTRFTVRQTLSTMPAITTLLNQYNVVPEIQSFMSRDFRPLGRGYELEASNISVCALLNKIVRESQTKYWIAVRNGDKKQYFVLNL